MFSLAKVTINFDTAKFFGGFGGIFFRHEVFFALFVKKTGKSLAVCDFMIIFVPNSFPGEM